MQYSKELKEQYNPIRYKPTPVKPNPYSLHVTSEKNETWMGIDTQWNCWLQTLFAQHMGKVGPANEWIAAGETIMCRLICLPYSSFSQSNILANMKVLAHLKLREE